MSPSVSTRITIEPGKRGGKPCIRGLRITVGDVLGWLGAGMTEDEILYEHPELSSGRPGSPYQSILIEHYQSSYARRVKIEIQTEVSYSAA